MNRENKFLAFLFWHGYRHARFIGIFGVSGLIILLITACIYFLVVIPHVREVAQLKLTVNKINQESSILSVSNEALSPPMELANFYKLFPKNDSVTDAMSKLFVAASQSGVILDHGEYRLVDELDSRLHRYDLVLPVRGRYLELRRFISLARKENTNLAVLGLSFGRSTITETVLDAQLHLALYLRVGE